MFRRFLDQLATRPVLAGLISVALFLSGILAPFAMPVLVLFSLESGFTRALAALASALVALILLALLLPHAGPDPFAIIFFVLAGLVFVETASLLRHGRSLAFLVSLVTLLFLGGLVVYALLVPHPVETLAVLVRSSLEREGALLARHYPKEAKAWAQSMKSLTPLYPYLLGIFGLYGALVYAIEFFIGASIHAAIRSPGRFGEHFRSFRAGTTMAGLTLLVLILTLIFRGPLEIDALLLFLPLYLLQGLALVHAWIHAHPKAAPLLFVLYVLLFFALVSGGYLVYLVFFLIGLGWIDNFIPLKRPPRPPASPFPSIPS